jgi:hypothetical protein
VCTHDCEVLLPMDDCEVLLPMDSTEAWASARRRFRGSLLTEVINILTTPPLDHHAQRGVEQLRGLGIPSTVEALTSSARVAFRDYILRLPAPMSSR